MFLYFFFYCAERGQNILSFAEEKGFPLVQPAFLLGRVGNCKISLVSWLGRFLLSHELGSGTLRAQPAQRCSCSLSGADSGRGQTS